MYVTRDELRGLSGLGDDTVYTDFDLDTAAAIAKEIVDEYTGTTFGHVETPAYDTFDAIVDGSGSRTVRLKDSVGRPILFAKTITAVGIYANGVTTVDDGITYRLDRIGNVTRSESAFTYGTQNVTITGTAGVTSSPVHEIRWVARSIARHWLLNLHSRNPDRTLNLTTAEGAFEVRAQAGAPGRPTSMPDVNAALNRHRHRWDV